MDPSHLLVAFGHHGVVLGLRPAVELKRVLPQMPEFLFELKDALALALDAGVGFVQLQPQGGAGGHCAEQLKLTGHKARDEHLDVIE